MIFCFLRRYFVDDEFLTTRELLQEAQVLLTSYEARLEALSESDAGSRSEADRVEPDFLGLIWLFLGVLVYIATLANQHLLNRLGEITSVALSGAGFSITVIDGAWVFIYLASICFLIVNVTFGVRLVKRYAEQKNDVGYHRFANSLVGFVIVYIIFNILFLVGMVTKALFEF